MPQRVVPEAVLQAVVETPEMWPAILEWRYWYRDVKTGRFEVIFGNGAAKDMLRHEHLAQGKSVELPAGMEPYCPGCQGPLAVRDYGNKVYCSRCDRMLTIWEIKQGQHYRPINGGRAHGPTSPARSSKR